MAGVRMTGMISGMDTESLIKGMMDAQRQRNKRVSDKSTKLEWKQDKWKELNTKLYKLYTDDINKLKMQTTYLSKQTSVSDDTKLTVTSSAVAAEGAHQIEISNLASAKYVTGDKLNDVKVSTKLSDLGIADGTIFEFKVGTGDNQKIARFDVTKDATLGQLLDAAKDAGLNANFDEKQGRIFLSSKASGLENSFEISTYSSTSTASQREIKDAVGYTSLPDADKRKIDNYLITLSKNPDDITDETKKEKLIKDQATATKYLEDLAKNKTLGEKVTVFMKEEYLLEQQKLGEDGKPVKDTILAALHEKVRTETEAAYSKENKEKLENGEITQEEYDTGLEAKLQEELASEKTKERLETALENGFKSHLAKSKTKEVGKVKSDFQERIDAYEKTAEGSQLAEQTVASVKTSIDSFIERSKDPVTPIGDSAGLDLLGLGNAAKVIDAEDLKVIVDRVEMTNSSNIFTVNGMTITAKDVTAAGKPVTVNVANNKQATYDMVRNFVKSYNSILGEMNKLYYAESSKGYEPLSDDEQEAMSESQINKWEGKIKDSILRRDSKVGSVIDTLKTIVTDSIEVDGKRYSLGNFGIHTSKDYTEKGLLHIDGDSENPLYGADTDKLMKAIEDDPDLLMQVLTGIGTNLSNAMSEKMKAIPNVSSALTFYDDKLMIEQQKTYKRQMATLEKKLIQMENRYYKQFSAMETAMAKLQSQSNSLAGMLGS